MDEIWLGKIDKEWNDFYKEIGDMKATYKRRQRRKWALIVGCLAVCLLIQSVCILYS